MAPMPTTIHDLGSHCGAALFAGDVPLFALADGTVHRWGADRANTRAHSAMLAATATPDRTALLTSGEDGRVCRTGHSGEPVEVAAVPRKWIGCVASSVSGNIAYAAGRSVWVSGESGPPREMQHARTVAGIGFSRDGTSLAVARYGGITVHSVDGAAPPVELEWKGIYAGLTFSPDGRFLLAFMQDEVLHGWRLPSVGGEARHFRMTGYPSRIKDWSWSADGCWMATSGSCTAIAWPFEGPDGPMGNTAVELGTPREALASAVACHPSRAEVVIGYADGALAVVSIDGTKERLLRTAGRGAITAVSWHAGGNRIAFGSDLGECGVLDVPQRSRTGTPWTRP